jgi:hypothetical protein
MEFRGQFTGFRVRAGAKTKKLPNTPTSSDAILRPSLSLRPQYGAGCG